jgi:hypothetical protein
MLHFFNRHTEDESGKSNQADYAWMKFYGHFRLRNLTESPRIKLPRAIRRMKQASSSMLIGVLLSLLAQRAIGHSSEPWGSGIRLWLAFPGRPDTLGRASKHMLKARKSVPGVSSISEVVV